ncbi:MAG: hypothetical protein U9Q22_01735 [Candidatus Altiarchaeota archaeon]|nr:hypothetical protein [Candidatus Altiarchaeota archaeon]
MREAGIALILVIALCGCIERPDDTGYSGEDGYPGGTEPVWEDFFETTSPPAKKAAVEKTPEPSKPPQPPCKTLEGRRKDTCLYGLVIKNNDIGLCDKIQGHTTQSMCLAAAKKDPNICKLIGDKQERDTCLKGVALTKKDPRTCEDITTQSIKNTCYLTLAREKKDYSLCNKITGALRKICLNCSLKIISMDKEGTVKDYRDSVEIVATAENCRNLNLESYGDPKYLAYVSKSSSRINSNNQRVWIKYRCLDSGTKIPLKLKIADQELKEYVKCNQAPEKKCTLTMLPSDTVGRVKSSNTITIKARAINCKREAFNTYASRKYIEYVDKSHRYIPNDDSTIQVTYKCRFTDTDMTIKLEVGEASVTKHVRCIP